MINIISKQPLQQIKKIKNKSSNPHENLKITINPKVQQDYQIIKKIGRGKYSEVYQAINIHDNKFYVIKILKPVSIQKIKRQIKILQSLNHPSIIKLYDVTLDQSSKSYCLIFEFVKTIDLRDMLDYITTDDIKHYMKELLHGLKYCHENGIIHRDIKPQNILINHQQKYVKIADWGLAEYYNPQQQYSVRVSSRHYKGPQLLLNNKKYDYSLDIWSLGITFASMLFRTHTVFRGNSNPDQLNQYMKHFGCQEIIKYIKQHKLQPDETTMNFIANCKYKQQRPWAYYFDKDNQGLCEPLALDLLDKMLQINHQKRITVQQALQHKYFK